MCGWMDRRVDRWVNAWIDGWKDGSLGSLINRHRAHIDNVLTLAKDRVQHHIILLCLHHNDLHLM